MIMRERTGRFFKTLRKRHFFVFKLGIIRVFRLIGAEIAGWD